MARGTKDGPHPVDRHVGQAICRKRLDRGYNQSDLGRHLGVTFQQVQKYEKGSNRVSASKLHDTAQFLGCSVLDFFPKDGDEALENGAIVPLMDRRSHELVNLFSGLDVSCQKTLLDLARTLAGLKAANTALVDAGLHPRQAAA